MHAPSGRTYDLMNRVARDCMRVVLPPTPAPTGGPDLTKVSPLLIRQVSVATTRMRVPSAATSSSS